MTLPVIYQGYSFVDLTTLVRVGAYKARAAVAVAPSNRSQSQRILDFEIFESRSDAQKRAIEGARTWIDTQVRAEREARLAASNLTEHV